MNGLDTDRARRWVTAAVAITSVGLGTACTARGADDPEIAVPGADPDRGPAIMAAYGCGGCHRIPGVEDAVGDVGPPLDRFGDRRTIAGSQPNRPDELVAWLLDPPAMEPDVDMPDLGLTDEEADDVAAYLLSLG